ncbi:unnamed protein product, partial [Cladocopium goreaui]
ETSDLKGPIPRLEAMLKVEGDPEGDLVEEANEYAKENFRLKDEVNEMTAKIAPLQSDMNLDKYKSELQAEKKSNLVALNEKDKKIWQANKDQNDKCEAVRGIRLRDLTIAKWMMRATKRWKKWPCFCGEVGVEAKAVRPPVPPELHLLSQTERHPLGVRLQEHQRLQWPTFLRIERICTG